MRTQFSLIVQLQEGKSHFFGEDLSKIQDQNGLEKDKIRTPHDIVTEDMFRRSITFLYKIIILNTREQNNSAQPVSRLLHV